MNKVELGDFYISNLQDSYTIMYAYLVRGLLDDFGIEGEKQLGRNTKIWKGQRIKRRQQHLSKGFKINMKNLFSVGADLPNDPRFKGIFRN